MHNSWYFDVDYPRVYQDDERGQDETDDIEQRIGSRLLRRTFRTNRRISNLALQRLQRDVATFFFCCFYSLGRWQATHSTL